jgi:hypothetical protein
VGGEILPGENFLEVKVKAKFDSEEIARLACISMSVQ